MPGTPSRSVTSKRPTGTKRYIFQRADIRERDAIDKIMASMT